MKILDQDDVDTLLASATADSASGMVDSPSAGSGTAPLPDLPSEFRLVAAESNLQRLLPITVPVRVRLAECKMNIARILKIAVGTIIEFDRASDADLDLVVNNVPIGTGNAVKCGEKFGLRVIRIQPWAQNLLAHGLIR